MVLKERELFDLLGLGTTTASTTSSPTTHWGCRRSLGCLNNSFGDGLISSLSGGGSSRLTILTALLEITAGLLLETTTRAENRGLAMKGVTVETSNIHRMNGMLIVVSLSQLELNTLTSAQGTEAIALSLNIRLMHENVSVLVLTIT